MHTQTKTSIHNSRRSARKRNRIRPSLALVALLLLTAAIGQALANPDGGVVVGGQAAITQAPGVTTIDQSSNRAIINWRGFSIDRGELTRFNQPGKEAIALNRVLGKDPSKLLGQLKANGQVWLVNPNGILFGPSARIDVHGLLATTTDIDDRDFLTGHNHFSIPSSNADASVINQGEISIGEHGLAGLVAPHVHNAGVIQGRMGQVVIAGTPTFTLDFYGDGLIQFEATSKVTEKSNSAVALVRNDGLISVEGGDVLITASAAAGLVDEAINMDGIVEARSVGAENGTIVLNGGDEGIVRVAGRLDASGQDSGESGGTVKVLGEKVGLFAGTEIDASGDAGGGEVLVGGNFQGKGSEPNAKRTYVASEASIHADALTNGDGGKVIVWADGDTQFKGHVGASGGVNGGNGGFVEISGKENLSFEGTVDIKTRGGQPGTLLLDPENIIIVDGAEAPDDTELDDNEILAGDSPGATFTISESVLEGLPAAADVILEATNDITVQSLQDSTLNFQATTGSVTMRADGTFSSQNTDIETQGGDLVIDAGTVAGSSMEVRTNGGDIDVTSRSGGIPVGLFLFANSSSAANVGGNISIQAQGDIFLSGRPLNIDSSGPLGGGFVSITSSDGNVDIGDVDAFSVSADGGEVTINAFGDIFSGEINSWGETAGGNVAFTSTTGSVATDFATEGPPFNPINSASTGGVGGSVTLNAASDIAIGAVTSYGTTQGGDIELTADNGAIIVTGTLAAGAVVFEQGVELFTTDQGGTITLQAGGDIVAGEIFSVGELSDGDISLTSSGGGINVSGTIGETIVSDGTGGSVLLDASSDIVATNIFSMGGAGSGDITLVSSNGAIDTTDGSVDASSTIGTGGAVDLSAAGNITTGDMLSSSEQSSGGAITLQTDGNITTGTLTLGSLAGTGGGPLTANTQGIIEISGLTPNGADTVLGELNTPSNILLPEVVDTGDGSVSLFVADQYTFVTDLTTGNGNFSLNGQQAINIAAPVQTTGGDVGVQTDSGSLTVDAAISAGDTIAGTATVDLSAATDLIVNNDVSAHSVVLQAANTITQLVGTSINAANLGVSAVAIPSLAVGAAGDIAVLAAQISGLGNPFIFTDNNGLVVGQVGTLTGISTNGGDVILDVAGDLTVDESIGTAGSVVLQATENIEINAPFDLGTPNNQRVVLQAGDDISVNAAISTQGAELQLEANSPHQGFGANGLVGGITTTAPLTTNGGDITLIGTGNIDMRQPFNAGGGTISHNPPGNFSILVTDNANFLTNARTTGAIILGQATTAGDDGFGNGNLTFTASEIVLNDATLAPAVAAEINVLANTDVRFEGIFQTSQPLFINADADGNGSGAITTDGGTINPGDTLWLSAGSGISIDTTGLGIIAAITSGGDISVEDSDGSITVTAVDGSSVDSIDELSGLTAVEGGIVIATNGSFANLEGDSGLQPGDGRFLVYSSDPDQDTRDLTNVPFDKRYDFPYDPNDPQGSGEGLPAEGNFFLYDISPTLTIAADDATRGFGEPNPDFTFTWAGLIDDDTLDTSLSAFPILTTTADEESLPGVYQILVGPAENFSPLGYNLNEVNANFFITEQPIKEDNTDSLLPDVPIDKTATPEVPAALTEQPAPTYSVPALGSVTRSSDMLSPNDGNRELWGPTR